MKNDFDPAVRKAAAILRHTTTLKEKLSLAMDNNDSREVTRIILFYMGVMFDEGSAWAANLQIANSALSSSNNILRNRLQRISEINMVAVNGKKGG